MDVYQPRNRPSGAGSPIVLLIHGGAGAELRPKDWGVFQSWGRLLAAAGFVAVTFTHRLAPPPNSLLPEAASDVHTALHFVREHAREFSADADRVCVAVWSAGGPLLAPILRERPAYLRCVVGFYPLLDMQQYVPGPDPAVRAFLKSFSPISSVEEGHALPPIFIARAGKDAIPTSERCAGPFHDRRACRERASHADESSHGHSRLRQSERRRSFTRDHPECYCIRDEASRVLMRVTSL